MPKTPLATAAAPAHGPVRTAYEAELLAQEPDPERAYFERILPHKLQLSADYAAQASLWTDLRLMARTALLLLGR